jgi:hypothetical protein
MRPIPLQWRHDGLAAAPLAWPVRCPANRFHLKNLPGCFLNDAGEPALLDVGRLGGQSKKQCVTELMIPKHRGFKNINY